LLDGHYYLPPDLAEVCIFWVSGPKFLKLHTRTCHAAPRDYWRIK
jgi:hypothetical protein